MSALMGLFLFFAWIQDRAMHALAWWGAAYLLGGAGIALWIADAAVSPPLPYGFSNALLFFACGMIWNGARLFYGRRNQPIALSAGAAIWMLACQFPAFAQSSTDQVVLSSLIVSAYTFLTARELWRDRRRQSRSHWAAIFVPILHGMVFLPPIPLAFMLPSGPRALLLSGWMAVFTLETLLYAVGAAFIVLMMAKERAENIHKTAALTDTLTGIFNRRGFLEKTRALIGRHQKGDRRVTALMFDLDHFKSINDRYGHAVGDEALRVFAATIQTTLREGDIVGRLGGEEFAALLPNAIADATIAAERVRAAFEAAGAEIAGHRMGATVSIGAADAPAADCNIEHLLARADAALYTAKENGRNRIACAPGEIGPPRPASRPSSQRAQAPAVVHALGRAA
ncbi:MAG: GGDEF domain-containing protein [Xanthobacteraceae bacterium]